MEYYRNEIIGNGSKCFYPVGEKIWLCIFDNFGGCLKERIHEDDWYYMRDYKKGRVSDDGWEEMKEILDEYFEKEKSGNIPKYIHDDDDTKKLIKESAAYVSKCERLVENEKNKGHFRLQQ